MTTQTTTRQTTAEELKAEKRANTRALKDLLRPVAPRLTLARILAAISGVLAVVPYIALVRIGELLLSANRAGVPVDGGEVERWLGILIGSFTLRLFVYFVALAITHFADIKLGNLIQVRMARRFARVPLVWFTATNSGRVRKALQDDIGAIHNLIAHRPVEITNAVVMPLALLVYAFVIDWRLGLLALAVLPIYLAAMSFAMRGMGEKVTKMDTKLSAVSARMVEFVSGITVVKAFGRVGRAHRAYQDSADDFHRMYLGWITPLIRISAAGTALLALPLILLVNIGGGALLVRAGAVNGADVLATALIALLVPDAIKVLMNSAWAQQVAAASAQRLLAILQTPALTEPADHATPTGHDVTFDQVSYSYGHGPDAELVLRDVSFELPTGTVTALIGPPGSGKSTIATLLARFDDPRSGQIRLGGVPVNEIEDLYRQVGFVLQDPQLPSISIRDNIALGRPDATDEQIRDAARAARILDEIEQLPNGFDTVYGADTSLSGGQAQRIAIARAILVDAPVLILDEATALTDPESQHQIQQALSELVQAKTVLLIAHRPEVIKGVDQIVLLDRGRVVATGSHDELIDHPEYAHLWESTAAASASESTGVRS